EAVTRGKQLWGVEEHIRYRLALEAPGQWAGPAVTEGPARFAPGPLAEVAASTKSWVELEPHLTAGPERATVAAERVLRGESGIGPIPDLPDSLQEWEPSYPLAVYKSDRVEAPSPKIPSATPEPLPAAVERVDDLESEAALFDLVKAWVEESNGKCETVVVKGGLGHAVRALGLRKAGMIPLSAGEAMAWMGWAGASGGAYGRRRGAAAGRYGVWWAIAALADLDWPPDAGKLGTHAATLRWAWFDDGSPGTGWQLRVAVADEDLGLAWAISALDSAD
ncbi:MAG: hypothetical protein KY394_04880, partial [Actinobacteria bacterium]|nr:hypothetical protein [Actinomycetota bacterium]